MNRIAIVIPWFGRNLRGGAELHAWQLAARFASRGHAVEVLTTCCRAHTHDWGTNHLPAGVVVEDEGFLVRRFPVESRDRTAFDAANGRLLSVPRTALRVGVPPVPTEEEHTFCTQLIRSPLLVSYIDQHKLQFDGIVLLPYLYGPVLEGVHAAGERALLQPCLHDEPYAYLPTIARAMYAAPRLLFLSEGERRLALRLYGPGIVGKSVLVGAGVDLVADAPEESVVPAAEGSRFVLCLGRKDPGKKTDFLVQSFRRYRQRHPASRLKLVVAGPGTIALPDDVRGLIELDEVSEAQKAALLMRCAALFHPSENESYSRVLMEAWLHGKPVAVNADCLATATAVAEGGGWLAAGQEEWMELFGVVDGAADAELEEIGERGRVYAADLANWDAVIARYEQVIDDLKPVSPTPLTKTPIHQLLPNLAVGDAISNHARWLRRKLRDWGHPSEIHALALDSRLSGEASIYVDGSLAPGDAVLLHHSIGSAITPAIQAHPGPKCLVYHNITPPAFLEPYLPLHTRLCREGRDQLPLLAPFFPVSVGDSNYNAVDLAGSGFRDPGVLPICVDPVHWQTVPDAALMARLQDGRTNVLFVGRIIPNKKQEDLIYAFARLRERDPTARLLLVGMSVTSDDLYLACLKELCRELDLVDAVDFCGYASDEELVAYYRTAHLFWSMSEHEGFCIPLVEAMWFDVPVFAFGSSAVPETLEGAGEIFFDKEDFGALAARAHDLARDPAVRREVILRQRARRNAFLAEPVTRELRALVTRMLEPAAVARVASSPEIAVDAVRRIAVVKLDHIGDLLLAQPVFESLARRFPDASITAIVAPESAPVLRNDPHVTGILPYDAPWFWRDIPAGTDAGEALARNAETMRRLSEQPFDLVVNLRSDHANVLFAASIPHRYLLSYTNDSPYPFLITHPVTRTTAMHICDQHRALLACVGATYWGPPRLHPSVDDRRLLAAEHPMVSGTVAIFAGAGVPLKRWSAAHFRDLVRRLRLRGHPVVLIGAVGDAAVASAIAMDSGATNLCGRFDLLQLATLLEQCAVLVTNDSAPMHIGAAMGTTVVCITRPNTADEFAPVGSQHRRCCAAHCARPCEGFNPERRDQAAAYCRCIQGITVDDVEVQVEEVLATH